MSNYSESELTSQILQLKFNLRDAEDLRNSALKARDEAMWMAAGLREMLQATELHMEMHGLTGIISCVDQALSSTTPVSDWLAAHDAEVRARVCNEIITEMPSLNSMHRELIEAKAKENKP